MVPQKLYLSLLILQTILLETGAQLQKLYGN